jgi:hypothetical protein
MKRQRSSGFARRALTYADSAVRRGALAGVLLFGSTVLWAQQPAPRGTAAAPPSARDQAPWDPSGYWVSLITQNWRWRMVVVGPGDYIGIPINAEAKKIADAWNPAAVEAAGKQCEAHGGGIVMDLPERIHVSWVDANELKVDTDTAMQTRLLHFMSAGRGAPGGARAAPPSRPTEMAPSLQGYSVARWVTPAGGQGRPGGAGMPRSPYGSIQVTTDHMLPGLLRTNGIPYGADAKKTEWWDLRQEGTGEQWLVISTTLEDPQYLTRPYVYDPIFQKEADGAKWDPTPCSLTP